MVGVQAANLTKTIITVQNVRHTHSTNRARRSSPSPDFGQQILSEEKEKSRRWSDGSRRGHLCHALPSHRNSKSRSRHQWPFKPEHAPRAVDARGHLSVLTKALASRGSDQQTYQSQPKESGMCFKFQPRSSLRSYILLYRNVSGTTLAPGSSSTRIKSSQSRPCPVLKPL